MKTFLPKIGTIGFWAFHSNFHDGHKRCAEACQHCDFVIGALFNNMADGEKWMTGSTKLQTYYIGHTSHIEERLKRHNSDREKSTKSKGPWELIYSEQFNTRSKAITREKQIKSYKGGSGFRKLIMTIKKTPN